MLNLNLKNFTKKGYCFTLFLLLIVTSIPIFCMYIMEGGMATQSIARLQELAQIKLVFFPEMEYASENGLASLALNSNLFYFLPALFLRLTSNIRWTWALLLFFLQAATMGGALLLFRYLYPEGSGFLWGVLLYMTFPFRIYLCYDLAELSQVLVWALLPYYLWGILHVVQNRKRHLFLWVSALFLAGMGYADAGCFPIILGFTLLLILLSRNAFPLLAMAGGTLLALPGLKRLLSFLLSEDMAGLNIPLASIMPRGYAVGELFSAFIYADGKPGIGPGLLFVFALLIYFQFVEGQKLLAKGEAAYVGAGIFLLLLSLRYFPWDYLQRVSPVFLKMVSLFQTPGQFLYLACFLFTIPAAGVMHRICEKKDKYTASFLAVLLLILCLGTVVYQCNTYIFTRLPFPA